MPCPRLHKFADARRLALRPAHASLRRFTTEIADMLPQLPDYREPPQAQRPPHDTDSALVSIWGEVLLSDVERRRRCI